MSAVESPVARPAGVAHQNAEPERLKAALEKLEARFLAEMFDAAGLGEPSPSMGGGPGEEQFASFLRTLHAEAIAARGGIGLAERMFQAMTGQVSDGT